ncbi:MAG TPA: metalloregulator ArsR/SmtB family transcription factor [Polyangiaceae bacterium]|jgi:DNA-binding transcriptional ArsR family regulator
MSKRSESAAEVFSALGDATRLSLVTKLGARPQSATALADGSKVTRQAIVKHLQVLEGAGLVKHEKSGREVLYALEAKRLHEARDFLDAVSEHWDRAIERLRDMVED